MSIALRKVKTVKRDPSIKRILRDRGKRVRFYLLISGILFIGVGFLFSSNKSDTNIFPPQYKSGDEIVTSFGQEPVKVDKSFLVKKKEDKSKNPPVRIIIPDIDINLPVKEAKIVNGYWEVFSDSAGFGMGSAYPDEVGNQVIFAHAKKGLFLPLKSAKIGQTVIILTKDKWYQYKILEIKEVLPSQIEVISPTSESRLTLYTCSGFSDNKRLIVVANKAE